MTIKTLDVNVKLLQKAPYLRCIHFQWQHGTNVKNCTVGLYWLAQDADILEKSSPGFSQTNPVPRLFHRSCVVVLRARMIQSVQTSSPFYFGGSYLGEGALPSTPPLLFSSRSHIKMKRCLCNIDQY